MQYNHFSWRGRNAPVEQLKPEIEYHIGSCLYLLGEYQDAGNVLGNLLETYDEGSFTENAGFFAW